MTKRLALVALVILSLSIFAEPAHAASADSFLCRIFGIGCPDPNAPPPFVPTYEKDVMLLSPFGPPSPRNEWYFATESTAKEVCKRLACQGVYVRPQCSSGGGPNTCTAPEREIVFPDFNKNAGIYASNWTRNPEDEYPGWALKLAKMQLAADRSAAKKQAKQAAKAAAKRGKAKRPAAP